MSEAEMKQILDSHGQTLGKHERRIAELETDHGRLLTETVTQTGLLTELKISVGKPPNPFGATAEERAGSGLMRIAYEVNDARRFTLKVVAIVASLTAAVLLAAQVLKSMGVLHALAP